VGENVPGDEKKEPGVVPALRKLAEFSYPGRDSSLARLDLEDRRIEILLACEVPEDRNFINTRCKRDLSCGRSSKPFLRKEPDCGFKNLLAYFPARKLCGIRDAAGCTYALR